MLRNIVVTLFFFLVSFRINAEELNCASNDGKTLEVKSNELSELLNILKNDVLGTVPLFCRDNGGAQQLSEQNDPAENSLNEFVKKLKKNKVESASSNAQKIKSLDENDIQEIVFEVVHLTVMKKIWHLSSQNDRDNLLTSLECNDIGFNRFPDIQVTAPNKESSGLINSKKACQANKLEDLIPFMSKDVLAESLYNLKLLMPTKFDTNLDIICNALSNTDETLLRNDEYKNYITLNRTTTSVNDFSNWLDNLAKEFNENFVDTSEKEENDKKLAEEQKAYFEEMQIKVKEQNKLNEKKLKSLYEIQKSSNTAAGVTGPILLPDDKNIEIIKDGENYYCKLIKDTNDYNPAPLPELSLFEQEENDPNNQLNNLQVNLESIYKKGQIPGKDQSDVPDPNYPGYIIRKDDDGKYYYIMNDSLEEAYFKAKKESADNAPKFTQEQLKLAYLQSEHNKAAFSAFGKNGYGGGGMGGSYGIESGGGYTGGIGGGKKGAIGIGNFPSKESSDISTGDVEENKSSPTENLCSPKDSNVFIPFDYTVVKNGDQYTLKLTNDFSDKNNQIIFSELQPKGASDLPVPSPATPGFILLKNDDGVVVLKNIEELISPEKNLPSSSTYPPFGSGGYGGDIFPDLKEESNVRNTLDNSLRSMYQKRTTDIKLIDTLTTEEKKALMDYTGSGYVQYNNCLRENSCSKQVTKDIQSILSALKKIKSKDSNKNTQTLFRGTQSLPQNIIDQLKANPPKEIILDKGFMSTSGTFNTAAGFAASVDTPPKGGSYIFVMKTKSCVGIAQISLIQGEDEFLCPPGLSFKVTRKDKNSNIYYLEEVSTPN